MSLHDLRYKLSEDGIKIMAGCAATQFIDEIREATKHAFEEITITIDYDPDFGICRIVGVNNLPVCDCTT